MSDSQWSLYWPKRKRLSKPVQVALVLALVGAGAYAFTHLPQFSGHSAKVSTVVQRKVITTGPSIPTGTSVQPANGSSTTPVVSSSNTLSTSIVITCPAATSIKAYSNSDGTNTLIVSPPKAPTVRSTGSTPVITTYSPTYGKWHVSDVTTGSTDGIEWVSNGASCVQG